jgi:hypothetical protein
MSTHKCRVVVLTIGVALLGMLLLLYMTQVNVGVTWDGVYYLRGARTIRSRLSYTSTHFPPGTSMLLALTSFIGRNLLISARWLNILLFGLSIFLVGLLIDEYTSNLGLTVFAMLLYLFSQGILISYTQISSESPFFVFLLLCFLMLIRFLDNRRTSTLIIASVACTGAFMTRYSGITIAISAVLVLLLTSESILDALRDVALFTLPFSSLVAPWLVSNYLTTSSFTSRTFAFHPPEIAEYQMLMENIVEWFCPDRFIILTPWYLHSLAIFLVVLGCCLIYRKMLTRATQISRQPTLMPFVVFACVYLPFLIVSKTFYDQDIDFNTRQLAPLFISSLIIGVTLMYYFLKARKKVWLQRGISLVLGVGFLCFYVLSAYPLIVEMHTTGLGYTGQYWLNSETISALDRFKSSTILYTNAPLTVETYWGEQVSWIPRKFNSLNKYIWSNDSYETEIAKMESNLRENGGLVVYFDKGNGEGYPTYKELEEILSLGPPHRFSDGFIYEVKSSNTGIVR